jgi:hypothetical protein
MPVVGTNLSIDLEKISDYGDTIKRLFRGNEAFQILCEDYRICSEALRHWNQSASEVAPARREEYVAILKDTEAEVLQFLN